VFVNYRLKSDVERTKTRMNREDDHNNTLLIEELKDQMRILERKNHELLDELKDTQASQILDYIYLPDESLMNW
jgi:hypothetical protein